MLEIIFYIGILLLILHKIITMTEADNLSSDYQIMYDWGKKKKKGDEFNVNLLAHPTTIITYVVLSIGELMWCIVGLMTMNYPVFVLMFIISIMMYVVIKIFGSERVVTPTYFRTLPMINIILYLFVLINKAHLHLNGFDEIYRWLLESLIYR